MKKHDHKSISAIGLQFFAGSNRLQEIETRLAAIRTELDADDADLDALEQETQQLTEERARLEQAAERRRTLLSRIGSGEETGGETRRFPGAELPCNAAADPLSAPEYRTAFLNRLRDIPLTPVEERAFSTAAASAGAAIPTQTANQIIEKVSQYAPLLDRVTLLRVPGNVTFVIEDETADAAAHAENAEIAAGSDTLTKVTLSAYEVTKLVQISKSVRNMAIDAFESWLTTMIAKKLAKYITNILLFGTGASQGKGIDKAATWGEGNSITVAKTASTTAQDIFDLISLLPGGYDDTASFIVSKKTIYSDLMPLQDKSKHDLVVREGNKFYICGYPVDLDERMADHEMFLGALDTVVANMPESANITSSFDLKTNSFLFLGSAMFDCNPAVPNAFVKLIKGTA